MVQVNWYGLSMMYHFCVSKLDLGSKGRRYKLMNMSTDDAGTYQCKASNGVSPVATADVAVKIKCETFIW